MSLFVLLGAMIALSVLGVPLVFSILASAVLTILIFRPSLPLELVPQLFVSGMDNFPLLAIAFFFLAGELMNRGGLTRRILDFANALLGHVRGGLCQVGIVASMIFAGISGSAVADAAAVGSVLIPSMKKSGYPAPFAAALIETASVMGPIIPPSIPMIIYAVLAEVSVGKMFIAGVVPGIMIAMLLAGISYAISWRRGFRRESPVGWRERIRLSIDALFALISPVIIVGGIVGGVFTATEAGAIAAAYVLFVGLFVYRELNARAIYQALLSAARGTATVLVILGASSIFAWIIADQRTASSMAAMVASLDVSPWMVLVILNLLFFLVGMFIDPLAALIILVPIFLPIGQELGLDGVQFGVMIVVNLMIGLCTPPVGYLIYLTSSIAEETPVRVVRESLPFLGALILVLLLVTFVPSFTLGLPRIFGM